ncbi:MAG: MerR family transcriptional regulator, partial [Microgenomates group bacterium]
MTRSAQKVPISQAAKILKVSLETLRRWEKRGVLVPLRSPGGTRYYDINELNRLKKQATGKFRVTKLPYLQQEVIQTNAKEQPFIAEDFILALEESRKIPSIDINKLLTPLPSPVAPIENIKPNINIFKTLFISVPKQTYFIAGTASFLSFFLFFLILARAANFTLPNQPKPYALNPSNVLAATTSRHFLDFATDLIVEGDLAVGGLINNIKLIPGGDNVNRT